jgi:hypothetical protein
LKAGRRGGSSVHGDEALRSRLREREVGGEGRPFLEISSTAREEQQRGRQKGEGTGDKECERMRRVRLARLG